MNNGERTMNVPEKHRAIAHAWVDGAEIEGRKIRAGGADIDYIHLGKPSWYENWEYRIVLTKPSINWEHVAPEHVALATDSTGSSYLLTRVPEANAHMWLTDARWVRAEVFQSFVKGTCDWKDSLVIRPSAELEKQL
jgi:hypothetical protein